MFVRSVILFKYMNLGFLLFDVWRIFKNIISNIVMLWGWLDFFKIFENLFLVGKL